MSFLLDTNVLSEPAQRRPDPTVLAWLQAHESDFYTASFCIGEIAFGVELLPAGPKRAKLENWLSQVIQVMGDRILRFDTRASLEWGKLQAELEKTAKKMPLQDSFIAAIARRHNLVIATRNTDDFNRLGVRTLNPFAPSISA